MATMATMATIIAPEDPPRHDPRSLSANLDSADSAAASPSGPQSSPVIAHRTLCLFV